jgi:hypothetical protein
MKPGTILWTALICTLLIGGGSALSAQELDFTLDSGTTVEALAGDSTVSQENTLSTELRWDFDPAFRLIGAGSLTQTTIFDDETSFSGDVTELRLRGRFPLAPGVSGPEVSRAPGAGAGTDGGSVESEAAGGSIPELPGTSPILEFSAGRIGLSDFSGFIMDTSVDGASVSYTNPLVDVRLAGGYTGFRLRDAADVLRTPVEAADSDNTFAPARAIGLFQLTFPEVLSRQSFIVSAFGQLDLDELPSSDIDDDEEFNALYVGIGATGPLSTQAFYTLGGFYQRPQYEGGAGDTDYRGHSWAGVGSLRYYIEAVAFSSLRFRGAYASGDPDALSRIGNLANGGGSADETSSLFVPITDPTFTEILPLQLSNLLVGELTYSFRPFAPDVPTRTGLQIELELEMAGRPSAGAGSATGFDPETRAGYLGTASTLAVLYRPTSDLAIDGSVGIFWPTNRFVDGGGAPERDTLVRSSIGAKLSF